MIAKLVHQAPVPPTASRSNPKPDQNPARPSPKHVQPITTKSGTRHDSFTVATCAKPYRSRQSTFQTRAPQAPAQPRTRPKCRQRDGCQNTVLSVLWRCYLDTQYHIFHWGSTILRDSTLWIRVLLKTNCGQKLHKLLSQFFLWLIMRIRLLWKCLHLLQFTTSSRVFDYSYVIWVNFPEWPTHC